MGDFVQVNVSNSSNDTVSFEKKFAKDLKICELKVKTWHLRWKSVGGVGFINRPTQDIPAVIIIWKFYPSPI